MTAASQMAKTVKIWLHKDKTAAGATCAISLECCMAGAGRGHAYLASDMRWASDSAEKPPKTTVCTAPILAHASMATAWQKCKLQAQVLQVTGNTPYGLLILIPMPEERIEPLTWEFTNHGHVDRYCIALLYAYRLQPVGLQENDSINMMKALAATGMYRNLCAGGYSGADV